jgi:regulator of sigma E protease
LPFLNKEFLEAIPQLAVVLGIMVIVHEFGHFALAKLCGVRVEAFAIGFGRKLIGFEHGGTSYQINLLPLGGYVKMAGELPGEETHSDDPGEFQNHPRWHRVLITLAGPIANFILSIALLTGLYMEHHEIAAYRTQPPVADYVSPNSPIAKTGLAVGDKIVHIDSVENPTWLDFGARTHMDIGKKTPFAFIHNGQRVDTTLSVDYSGRDDDFQPSESLGIVPLMQPDPIRVQELTEGMPATAAGLLPNDTILAVDTLHPHSVEAMLAYLKDGAGKPVVLHVQRTLPDGAVKTLDLPVTPVYGNQQQGKSWLTGFSAAKVPTQIEKLAFLPAVAAASDDCLKNSTLIFEVLRRLFTREVSVKQLSSPIGIGVQVHQAFALSDLRHPEPVIELMAMISLNLGIFNLLPIPILDGGMIVFLAVESVIRRDLPPRFKERIYQVAFVCILLFAAVVIFNDLTKYLLGHPKS